MIPCSYVGMLLFLMSVIAGFPLHIVLLVVTVKYYLLPFLWKIERVDVILSKIKVNFSFSKFDCEGSA